ncbi:hypothetical protein XA68_12724 [Ophiocordyceps unilateralis]|uniref:Secreted protein n=1 Tax=Ophiocordyceps unilateralis TaxID=268505 RepID=A0A2A9PP41_OPHUN|nr:hypothetical protein XA68_12724 [Ophiocordyceps unilateralis]
MHVAHFCQLLQWSSLFIVVQWWGDGQEEARSDARRTGAGSARDKVLPRRRVAQSGEARRGKSRSLLLKKQSDFCKRLYGHHGQTHTHMEGMQVRCRPASNALPVSYRHSHAVWLISQYALSSASPPT